MKLYRVSNNSAEVKRNLLCSLHLTSITSKLANNFLICWVKTYQCLIVCFYFDFVVVGLFVVNSAVSVCVFSVCGERSSLCFTHHTLHSTLLTVFYIVTHLPPNSTSFGSFSAIKFNLRLIEWFVSNFDSMNKLFRKLFVKQFF
jgi:hypothetical protein